MSTNKPISEQKQLLKQRMDAFNAITDKLRPFQYIDNEVDTLTDEIATKQSQLAYDYNYYIDQFGTTWTEEKVKLLNDMDRAVKLFDMNASGVLRRANERVKAKQISNPEAASMRKPAAHTTTSNNTTPKKSSATISKSSLHERNEKRESDLVAKRDHLCAQYILLVFNNDGVTSKLAASIKESFQNSFNEEHKVFVSYKYSDTVQQKDYDKHFSKLEYILDTYTRKYNELYPAPTVSTSSTKPTTGAVKASITVSAASQSKRKKTYNIEGVDVPADYEELRRFLHDELERLRDVYRDLEAFGNAFYKDNATSHKYAVSMSNDAILDQESCHSYMCKALEGGVEWTDGRFENVRRFLRTMKKYTNDKIDAVKKSKLPIEEAQVPKDEWEQRKLFEELLDELDKIKAKVDADYNVCKRESRGQIGRLRDLSCHINTKKKEYVEQFNNTCLDRVRVKVIQDAKRTVDYARRESKSIILNNFNNY